MAHELKYSMTGTIYMYTHLAEMDILGVLYMYMHWHHIRCLHTVQLDLHSLHTVRFYELYQNSFITKVPRARTVIVYGHCVQHRNIGHGE